MIFEAIADKCPWLGEGRGVTLGYLAKEVTQSFYLLKILGYCWGGCVLYKLAIFCNAPTPNDMNHTYVTLIPKKYKLIKIYDFCLINLCNVFHKHALKAITNRLKKMISETKLKVFFIRRWLIAYNDRNAFEVFHSE